MDGNRTSCRWKRLGSGKSNTLAKLAFFSRTHDIKAIKLAAERPHGNGSVDNNRKQGCERDGA